MNNKGNNIVENKLSKYNDQFYRNGPVSVLEYVSSKMDDVHSQLYQTALELYKKTVFDEEDNMDDYRFVEIKNGDYLKPSKVLKVYKRKPYTKEYIDLTPYWKNYIYSSAPDYTVLKIDKDNDIHNSEIVYIDYCNGVVHMVNKLTNKKFIVSFDRINEETPINENLMTDETFQYKYYDNIEL